jgi:phosphatidylethanolamine/phosphatidyl-N-methylethanolamine N-methyltransferase
MKIPASKPAGRVSDEMRFFRAWMRKPLTMGAVAPSGPALARAIAQHVEPDRPGRIVELGPGTGSVTAALIARGVAPERLTLIEYNGGFCELLRQRFPGVTVVEGDAYAMEATLDQPAAGSLASIVSCLPLFTKPLPMRRALFEQAFRALPAGAPLIQFSYALVPPVPVEGTGMRLWTSPWVLRNVPPARVWVYRAGGDA